MDCGSLEDLDVSTWNTANDVTLKANWEANKYTITFDTDDGSEVPAITQNYGTEVEVPSDPEKEGYTFDGWDKTVPATMPAHDDTITAKWTANSYSVRFDKNDVKAT